MFYTCALKQLLFSKCLRWAAKLDERLAHSIALWSLTDDTGSIPVVLVQKVSNGGVLWGVNDEKFRGVRTSLYGYP